MAEVLGVVASAAGVTSLSLQILESVKKLYEFCNAVHSAPKEIHHMLQEIAIVAEVLTDISEHESGLPDLNQRALWQCETAASELSSIVTELETGIIKASTRQRRYWTVMSVLKEKKLESLLRRLERAKSTLVLAQICYIQSCQRKREKSHEVVLPVLDQSDTSAANEKSVQYPTRSLTKNRRIVHNSRTFWLGLGTLRLQSITDANMPGEGNELEMDFRFAPWFLNLGFSIVSKRHFDGPEFTLRPTCYVSRDSPIMKACYRGDIAEIQRLFGERQASPYDTALDGKSLLYCAALGLQPDTCALLVREGGSRQVMIECGFGSLRNPLIATALGWDADDELPLPTRSALAVRTIEVLFESSGMDIDDFSTDLARNYLRQSPLHCFRGLRDDFRQLLDRFGPRITNTSTMDQWYASLMYSQLLGSRCFTGYDAFFVCAERVVNWNIIFAFHIKGSTLFHHLLATLNCVIPSGRDETSFNAIKLFVAKGVDVVVLNRYGLTPLMYSVAASLTVLIEADHGRSFTETQELKKLCTAFWNERLRTWTEILQHDSQYMNQLDSYMKKELELFKGHWSGYVHDGSGLCRGIAVTQTSHQWLDRVWWCIVIFNPHFRKNSDGDRICDSLDIEFEYEWKDVKPMPIPGQWTDD